jgi:hypothetical protein
MHNMSPTDQAIRENKARYAALCKQADLEACQGVAHALGRTCTKQETSVSDSVKTLLQFLRE